MLGIHIPHVPYVYDVVRNSQHEYVIYAEYIEGKTLKDYLEENGRCTAVKTVGYVAQLCDALAALQLLGIVHRDIKPENIIISNDEEVYLIDFDISRMKKADSKRDTSVLGTAGYAAPEQFGFAQSDHRTDLYSLGVLINVMSTGCFPGEKMAAGKMGPLFKNAYRWIRMTDMKMQMS